MCQVLDDFLGVLRLPCSRLTPANRVKESSPSTPLVDSAACCLPLCPSVGTHEEANTKRKGQQTKCDTLDLLSVGFP